MDDAQKRTWAEIDLGRLARNYHALRGLTPPGCKFLGVVKANAYGHGAVPVAKKLEDLGADYLAVACLDEALELSRKLNGGKDLRTTLMPHGANTLPKFQ